MFFSVITKNLVTFKRWDGVKDEKLEYYGGSPKNPIFRGGVHEKPIYKGELPKKGGLDSLRGAWASRKRRGWCF